MSADTAIASRTYLHQSQVIAEFSKAIGDDVITLATAVHRHTTIDAVLCTPHAGPSLAPTRVFWETAQWSPTTAGLFKAFGLRIIFHSRNEFCEMHWESKEFAGVSDSELWERLCAALAEARAAAGLPPLGVPHEWGPAAARADEEMTRLKREGAVAAPEPLVGARLPR